jgi:K+/H+ antiporter YhaU regulatory subunit KhtT
MVDIEPESGCAGRLIRETRLREQTGTSILAIERLSGLVVNPGPDEDLQAGDRALLLGTPAQLAEAKPRFRGVGKKMMNDE